MSYFCHNCGTVIEEDTDTLCGKCDRRPVRRLPRRKYYSTIGKRKHRLMVKLNFMSKTIKKLAFRYLGRTKK